MNRLRVSTGYRPRPQQLEIHHRIKRFSVLVCHRRFGKTTLSINELIDRALRFPGDDGRFGYVAPYLKQAKQVAWDYLKRFAAPVPGTRSQEAELYIEFPNGSRIRLYGADNAEAMRGIYFDAVVLDEVADMKPEVWGEIVRPALADRKGQALFIGTPKGINLFSELYQQALADPHWYAGLYRADETRIIDADELALARTTMSDAQYRQEFLCDFSAASDNVLITIDQVSEATQRYVDPRELAGLPKILGVDVARFGDDRSVIQRRQGLFADTPKAFNGMDNMTLAGLVAQEIDQWQPDAVFIDAGRGEGVIDRLRQLGYDVMAVDFGGRAINPAYANKRTEIWDLMAEWLKAGGCIPNMRELKSDLCTPTYSFDAANRMLLEPKDKIKARGLPSPDLGDALATTFAYPVAPAQLQARRRASTQQKRDYDPYASL